MTITARQVREAMKNSFPIRVKSTVDGDYGYAYRMSSAKDWSKGFVEVEFDNGQCVWVSPKNLVEA